MAYLTENPFIRKLKAKGTYKNIVTVEQLSKLQLTFFI